MQKLEIYTDGSSLGNPGPGGFGAVCVSGGKIIHEIGGYEKETTNNRMELKAVIETIKYLLHAPKQGVGAEMEVVVCADSTYVLSGVTNWIFNWEKNGWRTANKKPVLNQDLWQELIAQVRLYKNEIKWEKVKGHSDHTYNDRADQIATTFALSKKCELLT